MPPVYALSNGTRRYHIQHLVQTKQYEFRALTVLVRYESNFKNSLAGLTKRLSAVEQGLDRPSDLDAEERAIEQEGDEVLDGLGMAGLKETRMIESVPRRNRDELFGVCVP